MEKKLKLGDGYIGGVCAGLGTWSGLPPILWRIAFIFIFPYAFWIYIILWIFLERNL
jgi:phage shock protein PspC (stress-responsive transcriptional regulator)